MFSYDNSNEKEKLPLRNHFENVNRKQKEILINSENIELMNPISTPQKSVRLSLQKPSYHQIKSLDDLDDDNDSMFSPSRPSAQKPLSWINRFFTSQDSETPSSYFESSRQFHRMIDRNAKFYQSHGNFSTRKKIKIRNWRLLYSADWFHSLINSPTWRILIVLGFGYISVILFFAILYYLFGMVHGENCHFNFNGFLDAFLFSLQTMATIGYNSNDAMFGVCLFPTLILSLQVLAKLVADALTIGVIYATLARPFSRASTVIFSNNCVVRRIDGKLFLMFQICELRKHQLNEAHVRLYAIRQETDDFETSNVIANNVATYFQNYSMRIHSPSDELGSMLLLSLPQIVAHEINEKSPLMPPSNWISTSSNLYANADEEYNIQETIEQQIERRKIQQYIYEKKAEVLVIVEGIDQTTAGSVQARHSYIFDEMKWNQTFVPCIRQDPIDGTAIIDFNVFHQLRKLNKTY